MITATYDYTGQNFYCSNYSKTFDTKEEFYDWVSKSNRLHIWHVEGLYESDSNQVNFN